MQPQTLTVETLTVSVYRNGLWAYDVVALYGAKAPRRVGTITHHPAERRVEAQTSNFLQHTCTSQREALLWLLSHLETAWEDLRRCEVPAQRKHSLSLMYTLDRLEDAGRGRYAVRVQQSTAAGPPGHNTTRSQAPSPVRDIAPVVRTRQGYRLDTPAGKTQKPVVAGRVLRLAIAWSARAQLPQAVR